MGKSLTETAKAILMNEETALAATLKPGSAYMDPTKSLGSAQLVADAPKAPGAGTNVGAAAAGSVKKDKSKPTEGARPAQPMAEELDDGDESINEQEQSKADARAEAERLSVGKPVNKVAQGSARFAGSTWKAKSYGAKGHIGGTKGRLAGSKKLVSEEDYELDEDNTPLYLTRKEINAHNRSMRQKKKEGKLPGRLVYTKAGTLQHINPNDYINPKDLENMREDFEISEELNDFIDALVAEGYSEEQIAEAIEENFELVSEEYDDISEESEALEDYEIDMQEAMDALFAGEDLSEDFKVKAATIFEAAVKQKLAEELAVLEEAYAATLAEEVQKLEEGLTSNVDDYLNYVVEQWTTDNEIAIEAGLRTELTEDFISGLRNLFTEHYIDIPEDAVNVVEEMGNEVEALTEKLNEEIARNVALSKMLNESHTNEILFAACEGLTDTQADKLRSLAEGIEYSDANEYAQKLEILKENYFTTSVRTSNVLDSAESVSDGRGMISEELSGPMAKYVQTLGRTLPR